MDTDECPIRRIAKTASGELAGWKNKPIAEAAGIRFAFSRFYRSKFFTPS
jgi:hypothetical protein